MNITLHKTRDHGFTEFSALSLEYLFSLWAFGSSSLIASPNTIKTNQYYYTPKLLLSPAVSQDLPMLGLSHSHSNSNQDMFQLSK
jgi:hypothetical protein